MRTLAAILLLALFAMLASAQEKSGKAPLAFHGKVTAVDTKEKTLTVENDAVPGWMEAMTMSYPVDNEAIVQQVKIGDRIAATVYHDDYTLHNVHVIPPSEKPKH